MLAWIPLLVAMFQFGREVLRLRSEHATALGVNRLASGDRKQIDGAAIQAVKTMTSPTLVPPLADKAVMVPMPAPAATEGKAS